MEAHRRRASIDPATVESILTSGEPTQPAAPPSPHVGNSPNRATFAMDPPPRPPMSHPRPLSYTPRRPNRLSLSFPIATSVNSNESARHTPTSSNATSFPPTPAEMMPAPSPADPSGFLVALAGQERRVLELKEELQKAEVDLAKLKKQWAIHEAHKKKAEIRHSEPLRPVQRVAAEGGSADREGAAAVTRESAEIDRRKSLLTSISIPKESRRKVITGGHTRTLSLLSPERSNYPRPFPPMRESSSERHSDSFTRSTTMPDTSEGITRISSRRPRPLSYQGGVTHGAKQIAEDVKAGLWTFLEDLRQATVGDEAVNGTTNRPSFNDPVKSTSRSNLRSLDQSKRMPSPEAVSSRTWDSLTGTTGFLDVTGTISDSDQNRPTAKTPAKKKASKSISLAASAIDDLDDDWAHWDSPTPKSPRWSSSTAVSDPADPATPSNGAMEDRAINIVDASNDGMSTPSRREEMPWPALDKLTPGNLRRTVTTIMNDWEKSLTPPPEESNDASTESTSSTNISNSDSKPDQPGQSQIPHEEALLLSS
ncbi:Uncharacterized protein BP5553_00903 [Venustampulla echinocandica]|uniref:DUF4048 domain-containing protein n=1 Tax=Venustampulla echinocandica TaxID=2656787 RepID=A0A370TZH9_9HELO|nr:Uncharacterized protein BP5553_00903 [Venustampulla echinocandica]RDL40924.1 Uncharacterized protein BP5553_00903 [Venustampulla echinocandica]